LASEAGKAFNLLKTFDGSISSAKYISRRISNGVNKRLIRNNLVHLNSQDFFYIQIQEGCSMQCSYCSIKDAIGPLRSRPMAEILDEFNSGLVRGFRNFQFMGDNAGSYGLDNNQSFSELLQKVSEIDGEFIVELTDINPVYLKRIAPGVKSLIEKKRLSSLYVPIQSGSERILRQMKRGSNMSQAKSILRGFREAGSGRFRMGTSVIVGYPGETMEELMSTISFCREARFDWIWCHSFSAQPNQPAAEANDMLPAEEIMNRARLLKGMLSKQAVVTAAEDTRGSRTCQG
jgi:threonylcarbamoyladenosine tRNA methylthiotransferase MtaB